MTTSEYRLRHCSRGILAALVLGLLSAGCSAPGIHSARRDFYLGKLDRAAVTLNTLPRDQDDRVLVLAERGMIRQAQQDYDGSIRDWTEASRLIVDLDYFSLTRGAASWILDDRVIPFRGMPYERVLLHAFTAKSFLALSRWDDAAVAARNIIDRLETLNGFPDDPYSHYLAGFCMEMIHDREGATLQYRRVARLLPHLTVDKNSGRLQARSEPATRKPPPQKGGAELVCFVAMGRSPAGIQPHQPTRLNAPFAEIYADGSFLGRSYPFASTQDLLVASEQRLAALRVAKTAARIAIKEAVIHAVSDKDDLLAGILRIVFYTFEQPDARRWETLPKWLQVARVHCPENLAQFEIVFCTPDGHRGRRKTIRAPLTRRGKVFVSFCRDL